MAWRDKKKKKKKEEEKNAESQTERAGRRKDKCGVRGRADELV